MNKKLQKEYDDIIESIKIIEKNIELVEAGRSTEFDLDELEEDLSYWNEKKDLFIEEKS